MRIKVSNYMECNARPILVTGSHRSGTTFLGRLLSKGGYFYIQEPFNKVYGIHGVKHWFPYPDSYYQRLVDQFIKGKANAPFITPSNNLFKKIIKNFMGSRSYWQLMLYNLGFVKNKIIIKDPSAVFLSEYFYRVHKFRVVVLIRHPVAFYLSIKKLNWTYDFQDILSQKDLVEKFYTDRDIKMFESISSFEEMAAYLWYAIYKVVDSYNEKFKSLKKWILIRHENLSEYPFETLNLISKKLDLEITNRMKSFVRKNMFEAKVDSTSVVDFRRNSKQLAWNFRTKVDNEIKQIIKNITYSIAQKYYSDNEW